MTKVADILRDAFGHLRVLDANEAVEAEDAASGIRALNLMMARWKANGLAPTWTDVASPADTLSMPAESIGAIGYSLAIRLQAQYGAVLDESLLKAAQQGIADLWRDRLTSAGSGTVGGIIYRALRIISGNGVSALPDLFSLDAALYALNALGSRWLKSGLIAAWTTPTAVGDAFGGAASAIDAFVYNLAARLASEYGVEVREEWLILAKQGVDDLWRDRLEATASGQVGDIIRRALRIVRTAGGLPDTVSMAGALESLNAMLRRWEANGISLGWQDAVAITTANILPAEATEAVAYNLALTLAPEYGVALGQDIFACARDGKAFLMGDIALSDGFRLSYDLPRAESESPGYCG